MAFVYFKCDCDKSLAVDASDAGRQVQCPDCGKPLRVPAPELFWKCACGEEMSAPKNLEGALVRCAGCDAEHTVPVRLGLKRDKQLQGESAFDVPRVPVARTNEVRCPKCGYMSPPVLARCPQCQNDLRKGPAILKQFILMLKVIVIVGLGWFLAAQLARISGCQKGSYGIETTQMVSRVESLSHSGNVHKASVVGMPAGK